MYDGNDLFRQLTLIYSENCQNNQVFPGWALIVLYCYHLSEKILIMIIILIYHCHNKLQLLMVSKKANLTV